MPSPGAVPLVITAGFRPLREIENFFRGANITKGELLYEAGHVHDVKEEVTVAGVEITGRCFAQTRINAPSKHVKLTLSPAGRQVIGATCDCRAGIAGKCKHAAAVAVFLQRSETISKTSLPQAWGVPNQKKVYGKYAKPTKPKEKKAVVTPIPVEYVLRHFGDMKCAANDLLAAEACASEEHEEPMKANDKIELFHGQRTNTEFPSYSAEKMDSGNVVIKKKNFVESLSGAALETYKARVEISPTDVPSLAEATLKDKGRWKEERVPRITGTKAYRILACTRSLEERAKLLISPKEFNGPSVQYGIKMESTARASFEKENNVTVSLYGLIVCPKEPWLACSPDGIFRTQDDQTTLLEIKCPYSRRNGKLKEAPPLPYLIEGEQLKKRHTYYSQIQLSLYVLQLKECWLYIYTSKDTKTLRIVRDEEYLAEAIPKLRDFYFTHYLPNLAITT